MAHLVSNCGKCEGSIILAQHIDIYWDTIAANYSGLAGDLIHGVREYSYCCSNQGDEFHLKNICS
jgi:hypothetical protein